MGAEELSEAIDQRREELVADRAGSIGECQEEVPFGEQFTVFVNGKQYMSCTHRPPHTHETP